MFTINFATVVHIVSLRYVVSITVVIVKSSHCGSVLSSSVIWYTLKFTIESNVFCTASCVCLVLQFHVHCYSALCCLPLLCALSAVLVFLVLPAVPHGDEVQGGMRCHPLPSLSSGDWSWMDTYHNVRKHVE